MYVSNMQQQLVKMKSMHTNQWKLIENPEDMGVSNFGTNPNPMVKYFVKFMW